MPTHTTYRIGLFCFTMLFTLVLRPSQAYAESEVHVDAPPVAARVYILSGQSNMAGSGQAKELSRDWRQPIKGAFICRGSDYEALDPDKLAIHKKRFGPEIGFAHYMANNQPKKEHVFIIKFALSGQPLDAGWGAAKADGGGWAGPEPGPNRKTFYPGLNPKDPNIGLHYQRLHKHVADALKTLKDKGYAPQVKGIVWMQGEADAKHAVSAGRYDRSLALFKARLDALCVPTLYGLLLSRRSGPSWPQHMIVAGEACTRALVNEHFERAPASRLANEYGPTEATIWATAHECRPGQSEPPIGAPIPGMTVAVVDHALRIVPTGVAGELVLIGPTVANGYVHDGNHKRFVTDGDVRGDSLREKATGQRVFRTGDRAIIRDGSVYFLGRTDDQLNVGGVRIEPGEIEAALTRIDGVDAAAVVAVDVRSLDELMHQATPEELSVAMTQSALANDPAAALRSSLARVGERDIRLVAHLATAHDLDLTAIRAQAAATLGPLQQPKLYSLHDDLPRTTNGKVDRRAAAALPLPSGASTGANPDRTTDGWTARIHQLFVDVLRTPSVGTDDSFFDLGGDSLQALNLLNLLHDRHGIELPAAAVHNAPTINLLAARVAAASGEAPGVPAISTAAVQDEELIAVTLQPAGESTPIVALHVIGPGGEMWQPLAEELGDDQPFHCLADVRAVINPWQEDEAIGRRSIDETATRYRDAIRELVPEGPVNLLGFCQGGLLAFETARQLKEDGVDVDDVILVHDAHAPGVEAFESFFGTLRTQKKISGQRWVPYVLGALRRGSYLRTVRYFVQARVFRAGSALGLPVGRFIRNIEEVEGSIADLKAYEFDYYDGSLKIVRSSLVAEEDAAGDWGPYVADLDVALVEGHGTALIEGSVHQTAAALQGWLGHER